MADYFQLLERKQDFIDLFRDCVREAKEEAPHFNACALNIQRVFRGVVSREKIVKKNYAAGEIQRVFRGLIGRKITLAKLNEKLDNRQLSLFNYLCIQIQRNFRGYYSRRYKHDQRRRKEYCRFLEQKGAEVRANMDKYYEEVAEREADNEEKAKNDKFKNLASNLHHLVSTQQVPGVYQPRMEYMIAPTMKGLPVEEHIRGVVKDLLRTRGISHKGLEEDINGTKRIPLKGLKHRLSIQASSPYDVLEQERRRKQMLHRILTKPKGDWVVGGKTKLLSKDTTPLCAGDVYMDPWANPMLVKGVPESQKQLEECAYTHKALFATRKPSQLPYVTRVGGNKSSTLANDVFDTMAEAQETGGAAQRHLGTKTSRFGLSANMDCRNGDAGTIPKAPLRVTRSLRVSRTTYGPDKGYGSREVLGGSAPGRRSRGSSGSNNRGSKGGEGGGAALFMSMSQKASKSNKLSAASEYGEIAIDDLGGSGSTLRTGAVGVRSPAQLGLGSPSQQQFSNSVLSPTSAEGNMQLQQASFADDSSDDEPL